MLCFDINTYRDFETIQEILFKMLNITGWPALHKLIVISFILSEFLWDALPLHL